MNFLIADSSAQIAERLKHIIATESKTAIIYTATSFETALPIFKENKPAVVLLGMNLSGNASMELLQAIKETGHQTSVIILSLHISNSVKEQCKLLGATIFLDKFLEFEKIPGIIKAIAGK